MLDYPYFQKSFEIISVDVRKQQALHPDRKEIQQMFFTGNIEKNATMVFILEEVKKYILDFSQGTMSAFGIYFLLI